MPQNSKSVLKICLCIIYRNILFIQTNSTDIQFSGLHCLRTFVFFSIDLSVLFLKSFRRKVLDKCFYNFLIFPQLEFHSLILNQKNPTWHCVTVIYEKQQIFCGLAKKGENYSQKPMPKLFSTVFSCSP